MDESSTPLTQGEASDHLDRSGQNTSGDKDKGHIPMTPDAHVRTGPDEKHSQDRSEEQHGGQDTSQMVALIQKRSQDKAEEQDFKEDGCHGNGKKRVTYRFQEGEGEEEEAGSQAGTRGIPKNVAVLSLSFLLLFTAFMSLSSLQTSINREAGVGAGGQAVIYGAMVASSPLLPPLLISKLGCKWTLVLSISGYVTYMAANFYPTWWLVAPSSAILGLMAPCLWSAKCIYLTDIAVRWSKVRSLAKDATISKFFGIFFMIFHSGQIWGNLISSSIFKPGNDVNGTANVTSCGAAFCPWVPLNQTALVPPEAMKVYIVFGVFIGCAILSACIIAFLLDPLNRKENVSADPGHAQKSQWRENLRLLTSTFKHILKNRKQQLLIPLTMWTGLQKAFVYGDFTQAYAGCALGVWKIGYVMMCLGAVDALASLLAGRLVQFLGHVPIFTLGALVHTGTMVTLLLWQPDAEKEWVVFLLGALWGVGDGIVQTNVSGLYGALFTKNTEEAFSAYRLWQSAGYVISFAYNKYLCTSVKIYFLLSFCAVAMLGYYGTEVLGWIERRIKKDEKRKTAAAET